MVLSDFMLFTPNVNVSRKSGGKDDALARQSQAKHSDKLLIFKQKDNENDSDFRSTGDTRPCQAA
jgi:hypothetical protein